ncbi:hypothetical protein SDC9_181563 [bioreactor metagenome]|uniref:Uncharacterized protein n=1 Tax=bioreactor metagenome TaxID=1076179 RepID=A0A645H4W1_9ZZZZ
MPAGALASPVDDLGIFLPARGGAYHLPQPQPCDVVAGHDLVLHGAAVFQHHPPEAADVRDVVLALCERDHMVDDALLLRGVGDRDVAVHLVFGDRARGLKPPFDQGQDFFIKFAYLFSVFLQHHHSP